MRKFFRMLGFTLAMGLCYNCDKAPDSIVQNDMGSFVEEMQARLNIPYVGLAILRNGDVVHQAVHTPAGEGSKTTLFNVASVTKVVFASTIMKLVGEGLVDLDEPLFHYYIDPDVADDPYHKIITARHILSQQSGFVNWRHNHPSGKLTFDFEPGTVFNYSGEGMEYLRLAIESKLKKPWGEIAQSVLFDPLKMQSTSHSWDGKTDFASFSRFYDTEGDEHVIEDHSFGDQAADDLMTTIGDMSKFAKFILDQGHQESKHFLEMITPHSTITDNQDQALGWRLIASLDDTGSYAIHHGGNDIGVATLIMVLPKQGEALVVLTNGDNGILVCNDLVREVFSNGDTLVHRAYKSGPMKATDQPIEVDAEELRQLAGKYEQPSGRLVEVVHDRDDLIMKMPGVPNFRLLPISSDTFFIRDFDPLIVFSKDSENQSLSIVEGENTIICLRI